MQWSAAFFSVSKDEIAVYIVILKYIAVGKWSIMTKGMSYTVCHSYFSFFGGLLKPLCFFLELPPMLRSTYQDVHGGKIFFISPKIEMGGIKLCQFDRYQLLHHWLAVKWRSRKNSGSTQITCLLVTFLSIFTSWIAIILLYSAVVPWNRELWMTSFIEKDSTHFPSLSGK